jgi:pimeloyl-ACP methyl ester carboxylesterase
MRGLAFVLIFSGCSVPFYAHHASYLFDGPAPKARCGAGPGFRYCLHEGPHGESSDLLYFLHYANGSERSWSKLPLARTYYAAFKKAGQPPPRVVTVSYGTHWNLLDKGGTLAGGGMFEHFVSTAMPWLEAKTGAPPRRYLWGMSQGGLNGALLLFKAPQLWSGAVFSCPAWYTVSVYAGETEIDAFVRRTGSEPEIARSGIAMIRDRSAGPEEWAREDPLARAAAFKGALPPVFIDCTAEDEYGFFEGAQKMSELLHTELHIESGEHCRIDARAAVRFLVTTILPAR